MEGAPPVANQIDLFMHFSGGSRDGLVARRVDLDTISSSATSEWAIKGQESYVITLLDGTLVFEWYMVRFVFEN